MTGTRTGDARAGGTRVAAVVAGVLVVGALAAGCAGRAPAAAGRQTQAQRPRAARAGDGDTVLVGYGRQRRRDITSSVSTVQADSWRGQPAPTLGELLRGRVPGLEVLSDASGQLSLRVRGATSFAGTREPLLVVDGMPVEGSSGSVLAALAPNDVARVDVIKDAAASIYGSRGGSGVVLITTKRR